MTYENVTEYNVTAGYGTLIDYVNNVSSGWFVYLFLIATYFIILLNLFRTERDFPESMLVSSFLTFIIAALFWWAGFLDGVSMLIVTSIFILSFVIIWVIKNSV